MDKVLEGKEAEEYYNKLTKSKSILFESIVGSQSYGLANEHSDVDKKFIFIASLEDVLSGNVVEQVNVTKDYVGYEIGRYCELLSKQNPNIIEMLFSDEEFVLSSHPLFQKYLLDYRNQLLAKQVIETTQGYAFSQIKKAKGTNKKWVNPMDGPRKTLKDFSYVLLNGKKYPFNKFSDNSVYSENELALSKIDGIKDTFAIFAKPDEIDCGSYGIFSKDLNQVKLSSFPKEFIFIANLYVNIDGYSVYCKDYKEYRDWLNNRNENRFKSNVEADKKYDLKNMSHCFRLLHMAKEIALTGKVNVKRTEDREFLLGVKNGQYTYDKLIELAESESNEIMELKKDCILKDFNIDLLNRNLIKLRKYFYGIDN